MHKFTIATLCLLAAAISAARAQRPARPPGAAATSGWDVKATRSEMTDQLTVTAILLALNRPPRQQHPALAIRCIEGQLSVVVATGGMLDGEADQTSVRIRWGTDPPEQETWSRATDFTAAFAPNPEVFVLELLNFPDLRFEYRPVRESPRVASFNARGLARHMPKLRSACPSLRDGEVEAASGGPGGPADSLAVSRYLEVMQLDLAGLVLAEARYHNDTEHYTTSMDAINGKLALMGAPTTPGVTLIVEDVTDRGYRARATHRSARGWTCGIIFARAQPYRSNQAPGESLCWTKEEKQPRALNVDSLITADASDDQVFMESVVEELPEVLSGPAIQYPDLLRQAGVTGRVLVQAIIDQTGRAEPVSVKVVQSPNPGFDQPAKNYVLRALFRPARAHGRAVRVLVNLPIDFSLTR